MAHQGLRLVEEEAAYSGRDSRLRVLLSAKLITTTEEIPVKVRNLSLGGAMLQGRSLPKVGSDIVLSRGAFEVFATIVWCRGDTCGIEFDDHLAALEDVLQASLPQQGPVPLRTPQRTQPVLAPVPLTAEDYQAARAWALPSGRQAYLD